MTAPAPAALPNSADRLLITGGVLVTMSADSAVIEGDLLIEHGRIAAIGVVSDAAARGVSRLRLDGDLVLPGFVQGHLHLGQTLFRGLGESRRLLRWLTERLWPLEAAHDEESAYWSGLLGAAECLLAGTTTIQDIGIGPGFAGLQRAIEESRLRGFVGPCLMDDGDGLPAGLAGDTERELGAAQALGDELEARARGAERHGRPGRLRFCLNPRFALSCSPALWQGVRELAAARGWPVHTHALEQVDEGERVRDRFGRDEIEYFDELGLLEGDVRIAHGVHLLPSHLQRVVGRTFSVCHCPGSNLKLGSGVADLLALREAGVPVSLGADGAACNNSLDPLAEARLAALLQKERHGPERYSGLDALRLLTSEGAEAIGYGSLLGTLEVGKRADLVVLSTQRPELWPSPTPSWQSGLHGPVPDVHDLVVFAASRASVRHVLVDGELLVEDGRIPHLDLAAIRQQSRKALARVLERANLRG
ncbi:MAG TPA: amidohydrolase family protein [Thermoanaerobaculia bacterium]|nr:amidohydrolase family protein [Thermoanaerobaculia bacterium]